MKDEGSVRPDAKVQSVEATSADGDDCAADRRTDVRAPLAVQAFVAIPSMTTRSYAVCELSRSGMFLAFSDAGSTRLELERNKIEIGTPIEVAFAVMQGDAKHRLRVQACIARITNCGIGVRFTTRNPPQLSALRELFARAERETDRAPPPQNQSNRVARQRTLIDLPETSSWENWDLAE